MAMDVGGNERARERVGVWLQGRRVLSLLALLFDLLNDSRGGAIVHKA